MAFLGPFNAALINPSLVLLSKAMGVSSKTAAYSTTTGIIFGGLSPFLWTPLTNVYGRRPITLLAILVTVLGSIGSANSPHFAALVGTRAMSGFGFGGMMSVGTACVNDMFFMHERGEKTGVYSIFITNGAHFAAISKSSSLSLNHTDIFQLVDSWAKQKGGTGTTTSVPSALLFPSLLLYFSSRRRCSLAIHLSSPTVLMKGLTSRCSSI